MLNGSTNITFDGNTYYSSGGAFNLVYGKDYTSLAAFQAGTGQEKVGGKAVGLQANPLLVAGGTAGLSVSTSTNLAAFLSGYQLQTTSPAATAGVNLSAVLGVSLSGKDMYGNTVSTATVTDGADTNRASTSATTPTATPTPTPTPTTTPTPTPTTTPTPTPTTTPTPTPTRPPPPRR